MASLWSAVILVETHAAGEGTAAAAPHAHSSAHSRGAGHHHNEHPGLAAAWGGSEASGVSVGEMLGDSMVVLAYALVIVGVKIGFGLLPLQMKGNDRFLSLANCFSAGVFLCSGLAHLLPEAVGAFEQAPTGKDPRGADGGNGQHAHADATPYLLCICGFLLTLLIEKVLLLKAAARGSPMVPMAVVLTCVLSVHSVIGGLALGIQGNSPEAVPVLFAILAHKWVEAFSLGVAIMRVSQPNVSGMLRLLLPWASSTPLGITIGWALRRWGNGDIGGTTGALNALASGTFTYVGVIDILVPELSAPRDKWVKFGSVCLGVAVLYAAVVLVEGGH